MSRIAEEFSVDLPADLQETVADLRRLALRGLRRMYLPDVGLFAFRLRRDGDKIVAEGASERYTAITLIGLAAEGATAESEVFAAQDGHAVCARLMKRVEQSENLGDVALTLWAALATGHQEVERVFERLCRLDPCGGLHPTVELAWALAALSIDPGIHEANPDLSRRLSRRILSSFNAGSELFPHWPRDARRSVWRSHVTCFADQVYPIQALAHYYARTRDSAAIDAAKRCAARTCSLQGDGGQWWWHFDVRTGRIVERYPVYSVHQDAMAPMALRTLDEACGADHSRAIERGLRWLVDPPELKASLIDRDAELIWRKVGRREPGKLSRGMQASASRLHPALRVPGLDTVLPPVEVDWECRPYHLGWLLYAWADRPHIQ